jgi:hypothetical protein
MADPLMKYAVALGPEAGSRFLWECALIDAANKHLCPIPHCGHSMASHDGRRRCHACSYMDPAIEDQFYWDMEEAKWNRVF